ncbi:MAG: alanine--tRNA ligase [Myxococcales bacterium]|nr:alanine--tRNA ligase [Myxococcales bacterium]
MADAPKSLWTAARIRQRFVDYFVERGHTHVPSSSLVPQDDPTLLFVNAGMNQFKDVFTGREHRPYSRAVTVQRCVRAGGKHNDLDNVGFTPRHQTMFEMLGNFSFGDYFKKDAIDWAWAFLTEELGLPAERLVVTVFDGTGEDAPADDEAAELWTAHVPPGRIYRCSAKDNFWQMGDTGPCGPCSEIHLYKGDVAPATAAEPRTGPSHDEDGFVELWNLVFMQYEKPGDGSMRPLPKPSIDTGSGLERVAAAVMGKDSNYGTDLLAPMVEHAKRLAAAGGAAPSGAGEAPFRVIADHARATAFLVADGVFPDRAGRSYVLRRIMRRAIRHGADVGLDQPFMHEVCRTVVEVFGEVYPELQERAPVIEEVVRGEEELFRRTLDRGLRRLEKAIAQHDAGSSVFEPGVAAELYDTYGFPIDLTAVILRERKLSLDEAAAEDALRARQGDVGGRGADLGQGEGIADVYFAVHERVGDTEFLGYEATEANATVRALVVDGAAVERAEAGQAVELVLDRSPFYAESGGQVGDRGQAQGEGVRVELHDTIKPRGGMHVHRGTVTEGAVAVGDTLALRVNEARRDAIRRNHSATHLLHHALRAELGEHVVQKGSLVAPERLRFDFSHNRPVTADERRAIEARVNAMVLDNAPSTTKVLSMPEAKAEGAIGLFGEKYGERVRVVRLAQDSVELCGGTHVARSGDIGLFAIVGESGIAQGVRRIEAVTGLGALAHVQGLTDVTEELAGQLRVQSADQLPERVAKLQADLKLRDRTIAELERRLATGSGGSDEVVEVEGVKLLTRRVSGADAKTLRSAADSLRDRLGSGVVVLGAETGGKATLLVAVTKDLQARVHAGKLVGALAQHIDGKGGGRPDLAQAGGPTLAGLDEALGAARSVLQAQLGAGLKLRGPGRPW